MLNIRPVKTKRNDVQREYKFWIRVIWEQPGTDSAEPEYLDYLFKDWQSHDKWVKDNLKTEPDLFLENIILERHSLIYGDPDLDLIDDFILQIEE